MTVPQTDVFGEIKAAEAREFDRLSPYLRQLDAAGWTEQSYCTDWLVYQVVSHIGSGSRIGGMRLKAWLGSGPAVGREAMQQVWGFFDGLGPSQMLQAYSEAVDEYLETERAAPADAGQTEVEGFAGRRPLFTYQAGRLWELALHSWDVLVARDRQARLTPEAVRVLAGLLQYMNLPFDAERAHGVGKVVEFRLREPSATYQLDLRAERPRLAAGAAGSPDLVVEGPAEELIRFVAGRQFVPGTQPALNVLHGSPQDLAAVRRALR